MPTIQQQIEVWKSRLLDTSLRNRLLNTRFQHGGERIVPGVAVRLVHPSIARLYDMLVRQHRRLAFAVPRESLPPDTLVSDLPPDELAQALASLHLHAHTALTEHDAGILFVVLGFLDWCEPADPEQVLRAPLLLLPVELWHTPPGAEYTLGLLDDEVVLNPTLVSRLQHDYALSFPDVPEESGELQPEHFFDTVGQLIAGKERWRVVPEAALGLFALPNLLMYHDLECAAERAAAHPILAVLAGEAPPSTLPDEVSPDDVPPEQCYQVLDADASQQAAIAAARAGASFVLQGPPGTGKSQTIANIIAECLAQGKRVLFVSSKTAALQVVYERLRACGLAEFCLRLYGPNAGKPAVLDELGAAMEGGPVPPDFAFPYDELASLRRQLNAYAHALHTPRGALGLTAYECYTRLSSLRDAPDCDAPVGDIAALTTGQMDAIDSLLQQLDARRALLQILPSNPWYGCTATVGSFEERGRIRTLLRSFIAAIKELPTSAAAVAGLLGVPPPDSISATRQLAMLVTMLREPHISGIWLETDPGTLQYLQFDIADARQRYTALIDLEARLAQRYELGPIIDSRKLLDLDIDGLLIRLTYTYGNWLRYLHPQYYRDMRTLRAMLQPGMKLTYATALADLWLMRDLRAAYQRLQDLIPSLAARSGSLFAGRRTDWDVLEATCDWTLRLFALPLPRPLPEALRAVVDMPPDERAAFLAPARKLDMALAQLDAELTAFAELFPPPARLADAFADLLPAANHRTQGTDDEPQPTDAQEGSWNPEFAGQSPKSPARLLERMADLDAWWEFCELRRQAEPLGIAPYLDVLSTGIPATTQPRWAFHKRLCRLWLEAAEQEWPELRSFQPDVHAGRVARFRRLDAGQLVAAQTRLRRELLERRPTSAPAARADSELAILRRELQQRQYGSVRRLLREIPGLLGGLKPCLLMSPLAVSRLLDPEAARFDLVIFDEAAQIRIEEAVAAVLRGKALVVVGDSQQPLPPRLPDAMPGDAGDTAADPERSEVSESLLDACMGAGMPMRTLCWHYRRESLIAFANEHFYGGQFYTFPDAFPDTAGVTCEYVNDGVYDRQETQANLVEARRVADLVCDHVRTAPERSLGVVVFAQGQRWAILHELERRSASDPALAVLFDEARDEPFFVKDLQHVQGDVRDVVIVSTCYGRDVRGRLAHNFGMLSQPGGERWLNVAITRARDQVRLVTSLLPEDIDLWRTRQAGPQLLRAYLDYAQRGGPADVQPAAGPPRSVAGDAATEGVQPARRHPPTSAQLPGFPRVADLLAQALAARGLQLERRIGHSDFRIAIAIRAPHPPAHFASGILDDGETYRTAPTARDRERLPEQMLTSRGWRIYRIWSAAWMQDADAEIERIMSLLNDQAAT